MEAQIRADEIGRVLKEQISKYNKNVEVAETGSVLSVGDGVARVYGLENVMAGELVEFPGGIQGMQFSADSRTLATTSNDGLVRLWSLDGADEDVTELRRTAELLCNQALKGNTPRRLTVEELRARVREQ